MSALGSGSARFGLSVWVFQETKSATLFATMLAVSVLPAVLVAPVAGAIVDRWTWRRVLLLAEASGAVTAIGIVWLLHTERLQLGSLFALLLVGSTLTGSRWPAHLAATADVVPRQLVGRAAGLNQLSLALGQTAVPLLGAMLLLSVGLEAHGPRV